MKLSEKGRYVARPTLDGVAETLAQEIEGWTGIHARTHWYLGDETEVDGADFYVGQQELGHIHLYAEAHIAVPRALRDALIAAGLAKPFRWGAGFVAKRVKTAKDAREASFVFGLALAHLRGTPVAELVARVDQLRAA